MDAGLSDSEADNVSLLNDSDFEDEALSPVDSYARRRSHPRDPLAVYSASHTRDNLKQQDADEDLAAHPSNSDLRHERILRDGAQDLTTDSAPVLDAGPLYKPPPDYAAATAHREEEERLQRDRELRKLGYRDEEDYAIRNRADAFDSEHPLVRNGLLSEHRQPTAQRVVISPTNHEDDTSTTSIDLYDQRDGEATSLIHEKPTIGRDEEHAPGIKEILRRHHCVILLSVALICTITLTASIWKSSQQMRLNRQQPLQSSPFQQTFPNLPHPEVNGCPWSKYDFATAQSPWYTVEGENGLWNPFNFSFVEDIQVLPANIRISGRITVQRGGDDSAIEHVQVDVATTRGLDIGPLAFRNNTPGELELLKPALKLGAAQGCIDLSINIVLRDIMFPDLFKVNTTNLDIGFDQTEFFSPTYDKWEDSWRVGSKVNQTIFHAQRGNIKADGWESRYANISTTRGSISGLWPLIDTLSMKTTSGDISIGLAPHNRSHSDEEDPFPWHRSSPRIAAFSASSQDGNIKADVESIQGQAKLPDRDFVTHIHTSKGNIKGDVLLGSNASLNTETGQVQVRVIPVFANQSEISLQGHTGSGYAYVMFMEPILFDADSKKGDHILAKGEPKWSSATQKFLAALHGKHRSTDGSIVYTLPSSWRGKAELRSETGRLEHETDSYETIENKTGVVVLERKGGNSMMDLQSVHGDVYLQKWGDYSYG